MKQLQMKIEQIAFTSSNPRQTKQLLSSLLGMHDWTCDQVVTAGKIRDSKGNQKDVENVANLSFNYSGGIEFEVLEYIDGPNWLDERGKPEGRFPVISHIGMHVSADDLELWIDRMNENQIPILQDVTTQSHTNQFLIDNGRHYRYVIFGTEEKLGFDFKLIVRIPGPNEPQPTPTA